MQVVEEETFFCVLIKKHAVNHTYQICIDTWKHSAILYTITSELKKLYKEEIMTEKASMKVKNIFRSLARSDFCHFKILILKFSNSLAHSKN